MSGHAWPPCPPWCEVNHAFAFAGSDVREHRGSVHWDVPPLAAVGGTRSFFMTVFRLDRVEGGAPVVGRPDVQIHPGLGARLPNAAAVGLVDDRVGMLNLDGAGAVALAWLLLSVEDWDELRSLTAALREGITMINTTEGDTACEH